MSGILLKLFDFGLKEFVEKQRKRKALLREFETLKRQVLYVGLTNNLPVELNGLRKFIIENRLVEFPSINEFFLIWLTNPMVVSGTPALNTFSEAATNQLMSQLTTMRI